MGYDLKQVLNIFSTNIGRGSLQQHHVSNWQDPNGVVHRLIEYREVPGPNPTWFAWETVCGDQIAHIPHPTEEPETCITCASKDRVVQVRHWSERRKVINYR